MESEKKQFRHAPGPITKEKLESFEVKESMTQLRKRDNKIEEKKEEIKPVPEKHEPTNVLSSLLDSDLLENISEDDDILDLDEEEPGKDVSAAVSARGGRGRGGRGGRGRDQFPGPSRGGKSERPEKSSTRGGRGGKSDSKRGGITSNKWNEGEEPVDNEEDKKQKKPESLMANPQPNPSGFMPRGQPSRRGRGEGRIKQGNVLGRQKMGEFGAPEEIGEWGDSMSGGGRGKGRGGKNKKERPGSGAADDVEEWETASETSLEEREKRNKGRGFENQSGRGRGAGRGGRGAGHQVGNHWTDKPGSRGRGGSGNAVSGSLTGAGGLAEPGAEPEQSSPDTRAPALENFDTVSDFTSSDDWSAGMRGQRMMRQEDKKTLNKSTFDRRQNKLPPRLAKQREVAKAQVNTDNLIINILILCLVDTI